MLFGRLTCVHVTKRRRSLVPIVNVYLHNRSRAAPVCVGECGAHPQGGRERPCRGRRCSRAHQLKKRRMREENFTLRSSTCINSPAALPEHEIDKHRAFDTAMSVYLVAACPPQLCSELFGWSFASCFSKCDQRIIGSLDFLQLSKELCKIASTNRQSPL